MSPPISDQEEVSPSLCDLALAAQRGDPAAREAFARQLHGVTRRAVDRRIGPVLRRETEIDDVVQDVFVAIEEELPRLRVLGESELKQWVQCLVAHRIDDLRDYHVRAGRRDPRRERPLEESVTASADLAAPHAAPLQKAIDRELLEITLAEIARLPRRQRDAVRRVEIDGQTIAEVAHELGRPESTIRSRHAAGLAEIARRLGEAARERRNGRR